MLARGLTSEWQLGDGCEEVLAEYVGARVCTGGVYVWVSGCVAQR